MCERLVRSSWEGIFVCAAPCARASKGRRVPEVAKDARRQRAGRVPEREDLRENVVGHRPRVKDAREPELFHGRRAAPLDELPEEEELHAPFQYAAALVKEVGRFTDRFAEPVPLTPIYFIGEQFFRVIMNSQLSHKIL